MPNEPEPPRSMELLIPWRTMVKVVVFLLLAVCLYKLRSLAAMLLAASLIATTLEPLLRAAVRRGFPRWSGVLLCAALLFSLVGGFLAILVPTVTSQGSALIEKLPAMRTDFLAQLPQAGDIRKTVDQLLGATWLSDPGPLLKYFVTWSTVALEGLVSFLVILVLSIYLVGEGEQVFAWVVAFLPRQHRPKAAKTAREVAEVVRHWITGQAISSVLAALYTFIVLSILKVPSASLLAVLAGLFDVIPVIGFFCSTVPALGSALTVSPAVAAIVLGAYIGYHLLETYFIVPKVFGDRLKLSMLAVILGCLVAGYLAGPLAILFAIPVVASYSVFERIWLQPYLESDTVQKHEDLAE